MELESAVKFVGAVYAVAWIVVVAYVALIGRKLGRLEAALDRLESEADDRS